MYTADELFFFQTHPEELELYSEFKKTLASAFDYYTIAVRKTQISFKNKCNFAIISFLRPIAGLKAAHLTLTISLPYRKESSKIAAITEITPGKYTHHIVITQKKDIDEEVGILLQEAYTLASV